MSARRFSFWTVVAILLAVLVCVSANSLVSSGRLRRVHKSTYSEASTSDQMQPMSRQKSQLLDTGSRARSSTTTKKLISTTKTTVATVTSTIRQRVDQAVQKVRARSKEIKMEQEQKRVDRKLQRDQKKERAPVVEPMNPHNLKMPDCPTGKVYNGRRCVPMGKAPKH